MNIIIPSLSPPRGSDTGEMAEYPFLSEFRIYPLPLAGLGGLPGTQRLERLHPRSLPFPRLRVILIACCFPAAHPPMGMGKLRVCIT